MSKPLCIICILALLLLGTGVYFLLGQEPSAPMEIHCKHFFYGYPLGTPSTNDLIIRDIYAMSSNDDTKFADWVAYKLTAREVLGIGDVERKWRKDPWLEEDETLEPKDYDKASKSLEIDRGHQAPLASFKGSIWAPLTNYLSNITPQKQKLNQGPWKNLEETVRDIVKTGKTVYVMTGPLFEREMPKLPECDKPHSLPSGYWKIIIVEIDEDEFDWAAFIFDQDTSKKEKIMTFLTTIDEVERRSHLDFLWELEDNRENEIESDDHSTWARTIFLK